MKNFTLFGKYLEFSTKLKYQELILHRKHNFSEHVNSTKYHSVYGQLAFLSAIRLKVKEKMENNDNSDSRASKNFRH